MPSPDIIRELQARIAALEGRSAPASYANDDAQMIRGLSSKRGETENRGCELPAKVSDKGTVSESPLSPKDEEAAFKKIVQLLNASDKSEHVLRNRLAGADYPNDVIDAAIARAKEYGFIDDDRFAEVLIRSRTSQGRGLQGIRRELKDNGIDPDKLDSVLFDDFDDCAEVERALALLRRKPPRSKNPRQSAYRKLVQKGFSSTIASTASRAWCEEEQGVDAD